MLKAVISLLITFAVWILFCYLATVYDVFAQYLVVAHVIFAVVAAVVLAVMIASIVKNFRQRD